jgi:hypothetical protein
MNAKIKFYNLGNADTSLITTASGKNILLDYANTKTADVNDKRIDLPVELKNDVKGDFDIVAFTHADNDHICDFSNFFFLEHAKKYQTEGRKIIKELWVPAFILLEEGVTDEARIIRSEARHRLINKKGIRVFSKPDMLREWLEGEGVKFEEVRHLITDAGQVVPGFDLTGDGIEFFVHAPFAFHNDEFDIDVNRNNSCLMLHATFNNIYKTKVMFGADGDWQLWNEIIDAADRFKHHERLEWDVLHISHHCSYLSLGAEKKDNKVVVTGPIKKCLEELSRKGCILISPSFTIPLKYDELQPPHKEAFEYYKSVANLKEGEIRVTMEHPTKDAPEPIIIEINDAGVTILKRLAKAAAFTYKQPSPRAGNNGR